MQPYPSDQPISRRNLIKGVPAVAAVGVLGAAVAAGVAGGFGGGGGGETASSTGDGSSVPPSTDAPTTTAAPTTTTEPAPVKTQLSGPLGQGMAGAEVVALQDRLRELTFEPGPSDGSFGLLTKQAVWAFEKLVLNVPATEATGIVTNEMWQRMQDPIEIRPYRSWAEGVATENHTEVYLASQVVVFFQKDKPVLISHVSSGTGKEWREVVTIDPGEPWNENGTEPIQLGMVALAVTPGGVFEYTRFVEGRRQSILGGMYDPAYFNYGIALHGAENVPLTRESHGCIRMPKYIGERFHQFIGKGDKVYVWDGEVEPEDCTTPYPWNRVDQEWLATTTTLSLIHI